MNTPLSTVRKFSALLLGTMVFSTAGCSDEAIGKRTKAEPPAAPSGTSDLSLTVLVNPKDDPKAARVVKIGPADWSPGGLYDDYSASGTDLETQSVTGPQFHTQAVVKSGNTTEGDATGWKLLSWALRSCMPDFGGLSFFQTPFYVTSTPWADDSDGPNNGPTHRRNYYMFQRRRDTSPAATPYETCDDALLLQEVLLCGADRLAQIADSVGTVTWDTADGDGGETPILVTIPPQQTEDRFIARDMALNALAHIAQLETMDRTHTDQGVVYMDTCVSGFSDLANGAWSSLTKVTAPGTGVFHPFDPEPVTFSSASSDVRSQAGQRRLGRYAMLLASAARLTKDIVERSVRDDIAGAQQQMAEAADASRAARRAWGVDEGQSPYNSLRHALRVLFGRLEVGNQVDGLEDNPDGFLWQPQRAKRNDPRCYNDPNTADLGIKLNDSRGVKALDLLLAMSAGTSARWNDVRPTTPGESLAMSTFSASGIVVSPAITGASVRTALETQLLRESASRAGVPYNTAYNETPQGQAVLAVLGKLTDQEIRFGLARTYDAFRLLADVSTQATLAPDLADAASAALMPRVPAMDAPSIDGISGIVIEGGLSREDLAIDVMARVAPMQLASQCGVFPVAETQTTQGWERHPDNLTFALGPKSGAVTAFQNVFMLGETFRRRLAVIADFTAANGLDASHEFAALASSEIRQWAASLTILREQQTEIDDGGGTPVTWYFVNLRPEDLGADSLGEVQDRLAIIPGSNPAHAECAAGLRKSCAGDVVASSTSGYTYLAKPPRGGLDGEVLKFVADRGLGERSAYVVLRPAKGKPGRVLATLNHPLMQSFGNAAKDDWFMEVVSPLQRKLANDVFGIRQNEVTERTCASIAPLAMPRGHCIDEMERDQFVPLANELTSAGTASEDSWRHYLEVAEQAAQKTDELGRQIIELGIQRDIRQEAAAEAVGELCGAYPSDVKDVTVTAGDIDSTKLNDPIAACIQPEMVHLVFLRDDPLENVPSEGAPATLENERLRSQRICEVFCPVSNAQMGGTPSSAGEDRFPFCQDKCPVANDAPKHKLITHAGLGLISGSIELEGDLATCTTLQEAFPPNDSQTRKLDTAKFAIAAESSFASQGGLAGALSRLRLIERPDREWQLVLNDQPLIGTTGIVTETVLNRSVASLTDLPQGDELSDQEKKLLASVYPACVQLNNCSKFGEVIQGVFPAVDPQTDPYYRILREEVERAYFYLGAMAGGIPAGNITIPMPVGNRANVTLLPAGESVPAPAVYGADRFVPIGASDGPHIISREVDGGATGYTGVSPWTEEDSSLLDNALPFEDPAYFADRLPAANAWRGAVYQNAQQGGYLYLTTENAAIGFEPALWPGDPEANSRQFLKSWLKGRVAQTYDALPEASGDQTLVDILDEAAFFTPKQICPDATKLRRGRQVCTEARVSPVFYTTRSDEYCQDFAQIASATLRPRDGLIVTHTAVAPVSLYSWDAINETANVSRDGWFTMNEVIGVESLSFGTNNKIPCDPNCRFYDEYFDARMALFSWTSSQPTGCEPRAQWEMFEDPPACANFSWKGRGWGSRPETFSTHRVGHDRLKPSECSPSERVELFLATDLADSVHALKTVVRALSLSCVSGGAPAIVDGLPPPLNSESDLRYLEAWVKMLANVTTASASAIALTEIPKPVIDHIRTGSFGAGFVAQGDRGKVMLELEEALRGIESGFGNLGSTFHLMNSEIKNARLMIEGARIEDKQRQLQLALQKLENGRSMAIAEARKTAATAAALSAGGAMLTDQDTMKALGFIVEEGAKAAATGGGSLAMTGVSTLLSTGFQALGTAAEAAGAGAEADITIDYGNQISGVVGQLEDASKEGTENQIQIVINDLNGQMVNLFQQVQDHSTGITNSASDGLQLAIDLKQNSSQARIALAKASGADFVFLNNALVPSHINTVYRRQFDVLKERYDRALKSAKSSAYLARLAIEERLGTRLDELTQSIGPLDAPRLWVDDVCTADGIDYEKLRTADSGTGTVVGVPGAAGAPNDGSAEIDLIKGFADQYIGDYVSKLKEFVEFYNVQFPFREADDVGIVSLREDLGNSEAICTSESKNLLFQSDNLDAPPLRLEREVARPSRQGWRASGCEPDACVLATSGLALTDPTGMGGALQPVEPPAGSGSATWLHALAEVDGSTDPADLRPTGYVYQTVTLRAGTRYILSWWDMARGPGGEPYSGTTPEPYRVAAFDADWNFVAQDVIAPSASGWSSRRALGITPFADGDYHVAFSPGGAGALLDASVAIANVQLEAATGGSLAATGYSPNGASRTSFTGDCPTSSPEALRSRFSYRCDSTGCWHELKDLLTIDTELVNQGASPLVGQVAQGNYNYRVGGIALNLVGTGVLDCTKSGSQSCYSTGYVEYDLRHHAHNVPIDDYSGTVRCFDFGTGNIRGGKALASERFLTLPLGEAARQIVSSSPFLKSEFTGRPLSGSYRLRIKDSPALVWPNVEDIQLLVNYRYWSRVDKAFGQ